jgi:hypothetical protein
MEAAERVARPPPGSVHRSYVNRDQHALILERNDA